MISYYCSTVTTVSTWNRRRLVSRQSHQNGNPQQQQQEEQHQEVSIEPLTLRDAAKSMNKGVAGPEINGCELPAACCNKNNTEISTNSTRKFLDSDNPSSYAAA